MQIHRRNMLVLGAATLGASAFAQSFPNKPVTLIVPFAPGGNIDIVARALSVPLAKALGQSVLVDNRAGGGGAIGTALVAAAHADGYTVLVATPGQISTLPQMFKTPYKVANFLPVGVASKTSMVITTRKNDSRFKTVGEFIAFAKANPGRINCGHAGPGTPNHLAILQMENAAGIQLSAVAYKGSGPALVDLLGGTLDAVFDQISSSMPHFKAGNLQALAVLGPQPEALLPGVPTLAQSGLPEFDSTTYAGLLLPAGTPPAVVGTLGAALKKALADPQMNASLKELGSSVYDADAAAFSRMLVSEDQLATAMVRDGKLKSD